MPLTGPALPNQKSQDLARGERRYRRKVASPKRWQAIIDAKMGPCRCARVLGAACDGPVEFHHIWPRDLGGPDSESNILPLCHWHHNQVTVASWPTVFAMLSDLTDDEYAFVVSEAGEDIWKRAYGITYERTA